MTRRRIKGGEWKTRRFLVNLTVTLGDFCLFENVTKDISVGIRVFRPVFTPIEVAPP